MRFRSRGDAGARGTGLTVNSPVINTPPFFILPIPDKSCCADKTFLMGIHPSHSIYARSSDCLLINVHAAATVSI